jgi:signal transduction histidine kinase
MSAGRTRQGPQRFLAAAVAVVALALVVLTASAYRAIREWRDSSSALVEQWAQGAADLIVMALTRDMTGVQRLLANRDFVLSASADVADATQQVASAFARYPYPESFFVWNAAPGAAEPFVFYYRANRPPSWIGERPTAPRYPVEIADGRFVAGPIRQLIGQDAAARRQFAVFETTLSGGLYQVVARLEYADPYRERLQRAVGFMVDLGWARRAYFAEIVAQVMPIVSRGVAMDVHVVDDAGESVAGAAVPGGATRPLPLLFAESPLVMHDPRNLVIRSWNIHVSADRSAAAQLMTSGPRLTLGLVIGAALALLASVVMTARAVMSSAAVSEMRSDFVSTVTHELKTPLATIQAIGQTLAHGRVLGADRVGQYAQVLAAETKRLTRLVDNLLAYARVTDVTEVYAFEPLAPSELVDDALREFRFQLAERQFAVDVDVPVDLPPVLADRTALCLAIDNLIDNAIRHSGGERRWIGISARAEQSQVRIAVRDRGVGIPPDEIEIVQRRFVRGRQAKAGGNGLGLAIVRQIVADHGGTFQLESVLNGGTTASLTLKAV